MMKHSVKLLLAGAVFISSCCTGEGGGSSVVSGTVYHHSEEIGYSKVYVKYDAKELPSTDVSVYNQSVTSDENGHYSLKGLKCGDYYLYAVGVDPDAVAPDTIVKGGTPITISKDGTNKEVDVYVTE